MYIFLPTQLMFHFNVSPIWYLKKWYIYLFKKKYKVYCKNSFYYHYQFFVTNSLFYWCCSGTKVLSNLRCHGLYVAYLSPTISWRLLKFMSSELVMLSNHLLLPSSPFAFNLSQHQSLCQWVSSLHQVAKVLELQHQSFQWIFRVDFL